MKACYGLIQTDSLARIIAPKFTPRANKNNSKIPKSEVLKCNFVTIGKLNWLVQKTLLKHKLFMDSYKHIQN